uniref:Uncharacterized protein n=1 Tax=Anopheles arabiensis TaxID=7173 RepID=A0A182HN03_ANOAR
MMKEITTRCPEVFRCNSLFNSSIKEGTAYFHCVAWFGTVSTILH